MPFQATEIACFVRATVIFIAPIVTIRATTVQLPFTLHALIGLESAYLATVPALSLECPFALNGRKIHLPITAAPFTPTSHEPLDFRYIFAQLRLDD